MATHAGGRLSGRQIANIYGQKGLDDLHMLTATLMVVAQMFHHVPPGYGSSTETAGSFSWAGANSLMREMQWLALRLLKSFHKYSLDRRRSPLVMDEGLVPNGFVHVGSL